MYQIYPLSFADSNGDGFGDLPGVVSKLDYLAETLGVDAIWLSPFYRSPMRDWGYDVSDHRDVDPVFGSLDDVKTLVEAAHSRGLRVILDYLMNHTSDQHAWFQESRSSRDNPKRDWYTWRDGRYGDLPNNWLSVFGGPAWSYDEPSGQWYRHTFLPSQPDLNWRNEEVVEAMIDVARFWLDLGIDGFRVDAAHQMMKDPLERDNPPAPADYPRPYKDMGAYDDFIHLYDLGHPDVHQAHRSMRSVLDNYPQDVLSIGEIHIFDLPEWASYYGENLDQLDMPFNFHLMASEWDAANVRAAVEAVLWNVPAGAWTNWTLGNHDEIRMASRIPNGQERLAGLLLLTLPGTPFIYYGDEIGMLQAEIPESLRMDPWGRSAKWLSRDGERTPMQWEPGPNAGFTAKGVKSWLPIGPDHEKINVESELDEPGSLLNMYRRLLELRSNRAVLRNGTFLSHPGSSDAIFAYRRERDDETMTIILNFSEVSESLSVGPGRVVFSTHDPDRGGDVEHVVRLAAHEGVIVSHKPSGTPT